MTQPTEKILEKVRRLLALSKSSNEFEAAAAAAKAQELLFKYKLEMNDVPSDDGRDAPREAFDRHFMVAENTAGWRGTLLNVIALNNDCSVIKHSGGTGKLYAVIGQKSSFEVVEYLYAYLVAEIDRLAKTHFGKGHPDSWFTSFRYGCVNTLSKTLKRQREESVSSAKGMALVVVNEAALKAKEHEFYPRLRHRGSHSIGNSSGYATGQRDGATIGIRQGVHSGAGSSAGALR